MDEELKRGDVVKLKSGGPVMTIEAIDARLYAPEGSPADHAWCQWFNSDSKLETGVFPLVSLVQVQPAQNRVRSL